MTKPDEHWGSVLPDRAARICNVAAVVVGVGSVIAGAVLAKPDTSLSSPTSNPVLGIAIIVGGLVAALAMWIAAVMLGWAAVVYDALNSREPSRALSSPEPRN